MASGKSSGEGAALRDGLIASVQAAISSLDNADLYLFTLAVLHGIPITRLAGAAQENVDRLIGSQKRIRKQLTEAGFSPTDVERAWKKGL